MAALEKSLLGKKKKTISHCPEHSRKEGDIENIVGADETRKRLVVWTSRSLWSKENLEDHLNIQNDICLT
jgi:hypothetical protein